MSCCLKAGFSFYGSNDLASKNRAKGSFRVCSSIQTLQYKESSNPRECLGKTLHLSDQKHVTNFVTKSPKSDPPNTSLRWWEKSLHQNMIEIQSAQELVDSLLNAGERLVVLDFYSPNCGGCRTLHPKICQLAEMNPNSLFLQINYENHKEMCDSLNIKVLPFFRFYRGAEGRACSFSCTNATVRDLCFIYLFFSCINPSDSAAVSCCATIQCLRSRNLKMHWPNMALARAVSGQQRGWMNRSCLHWPHVV
ncbi:thioredoxin-like 1-2, chloroplastic isoform X2 [Salvia miltiorrhiza]|uniref:thioredoxin-like 1-2, chloroplastic isoform X2 n=1 Tax=Salvia miltiorrhiza TaxID=226208 RepID=UPI0025AD1807|nr:thioredoxin-like 1-2, chloroplastic isoform X2 [Salvia miltiorrhiza]